MIKDMVPDTEVRGHTCSFSVGKLSSACFFTRYICLIYTPAGRLETPTQYQHRRETGDIFITT